MEKARDQAATCRGKQADDHHAGATLRVTLAANAREVRAHVAQARDQFIHLAEKLLDDLVLLQRTRQVSSDSAFASKIPISWRMPATSLRNPEISERSRATEAESMDAPSRLIVAGPTKDQPLR